MAILAAVRRDPCEDRPVTEHPPTGRNPDGPSDPAPDAPDEGSAYELLQRGLALSHERHHAQAAVVLERAARLAPGKGSILEALGRARYNAGHHDLAREAFEELVAVDPASHYGHFGLAEALRKLGRLREAWTHARLAVALEPRSSLYRSALARLPEPDHAAERAAEDERRARLRAAPEAGDSPR